MKLLVIGVNHKTAPIALREQLAFSADELPTALKSLSAQADGCVIVSTCNRTEIYALAPESTLDCEQNLASEMNVLERAVAKIKLWFADYKNIELARFEPYLYVHYDNLAITHWIRVAAGLDSMILGEPQILGQVKQAVNMSFQHGCMSKKFSWVIDQVFSSAKQVRHETQVGSQAVTLGFATAKLATQIFDDLSQCSLLVVAAGEMNRLVASHIAGLGIGRIIICNRNEQRAEALASELQAINPLCHISVEPLRNLASCLVEADIVSSCSASMHPLINFQMVKPVMKKRRYRSMLMVDLAVPRDIDEKAGKLDEVYLYSIDDLQHVIAGNIEQRQQAAVEAEVLISQLVLQIERRFQVRQVGGHIQIYRDIANQQSNKLLADSLHRLQHASERGETAEEILRELTRKLTQNLTHAPSKLLRRVASEGDNATLDVLIETLTTSYRGERWESEESNESTD